MPRPRAQFVLFDGFGLYLLEREFGPRNVGAVPAVNV